MTDPSDRVVLAASEEVQKEARRLELAVESLSSAMETLRDAIVERRRGASLGPPFTWGVVSEWSWKARGRSFVFLLDGRTLVLPRGRVAYTLQALLEPRGVLASDGQRYLTVPGIATRVAELSGKPPQSAAAVQITLTRLKAALKDLRGDWRELTVRNDEVRGYRLAKAE